MSAEIKKVFFRVPKYNVSAQDFYEEVKKLPEITPKNVLDLARDKNSKLHSDFEWDNEIAGEKYRLIQAREMIINLSFEPQEEKEQTTRVFQISTEKSVYKPVEMILKNEDEYQALLKRALAELESFKKKYSTLVELEEVFRAIEEL